MSKFKVIMHYPSGEEEELDDVFTSEDAASDYGLYMCSCYHTGGEILNMSNPGDYPLEDDEDDVDFEVIEVDD